MIRNQWYAVLDTKELKKNKILSVKRMGEKLVFWRDNENIKCLIDKCAHRGAALSLGKIIDGCIQCPFHGFEYNEKGDCVKIPAKGKKAKIPEYIRVKAYPARESLGFIWIYWGEYKEENELPPIPKIEEIDDKFVYHQIIDHWSVHYSRAIENQLDVMHLPFVHYNTIGRGKKTIVDGPYTELKNEKLSVWVSNRKDENGEAKTKIDKPRDKFQIQFIFPNLWQNNISESFKIVVAFVPIDKENTKFYLRNYQKITRLPILKNIVGWFGDRGNRIIINQDKRVVLTQNPIRSELKMEEKLVHGDKPIIEYRKRRQELKDINNN